MTTAQRLARSVTHPEPDAVRSQWLSLGLVCASVTVVIADNSIVNLALPTLSRQLGASTSGLQWVVDGYALVFAGLLLVGGSLGDRWGRKRTLFCGLSVFAVMSVFSAFAPGIPWLIAGRAGMGVGAALVFPTTLSILTTQFTGERERKVAIAIWSGMVGIAVILGPTAAGALLQRYWWGSVFLVNVPFVVAILLAGARIIPESRSSKVRRLDAPGAGLSVLSVGALVFAVIEAPSHGWLGPQTLVAGLVGVLAVAAFIRHERHCAEPMVPLHLFRIRAVSCSVATLGLATFALFGFVFVATQYFQLVLGLGTFSAGLHYLPFAASVIVCAAISPIVVRSIGPGITISVGLSLLATGLFTVLAVVRTSSFVPFPLLATLLLGAGMGLVTAPATDLLVRHVPPDDAGVGSALNDTARQLGGALGVAVMGSVFASAYRHSLSAESQLFVGLTRAQIHAVKASPYQALQLLPQREITTGGAGTREAALHVKDAFMSGLHAASLCSGAVALVGAAAIGLALRSRRERAAMERAVMA
jgi:EmrB/QacA subfamily drug resistance transporter